MRSKHFLLLSASLVRLFSCEGVATDATPAPVHLVLDIEAPAPQFSFVMVPGKVAVSLHLADGWPTGGLEEYAVSADMGRQRHQRDGENFK